MEAFRNVLRFQEGSQDVFHTRRDEFVSRVRLWLRESIASVPGPIPETRWNYVQNVYQRVDDGLWTRSLWILKSELHPPSFLCSTEKIAFFPQYHGASIASTSNNGTGKSSRRSRKEKGERILRILLKDWVFLTGTLGNFGIRRPRPPTSYRIWCAFSTSGRSIGAIL